MMKYNCFFAIFCCAITLFPLYGGEKEHLVPISFDQVSLTDHFWSNRMRIQKEVLVPVAFERTEVGLEDLRRTGNYLKGIQDEIASTSRFNTSDLYKVLEGAAYLLKMERDVNLENQIDAIAKIISDAQEIDGYLYPAHTTGSYKDAELWGGAGMGDRPYSWVVHSHELYNVGHLYEAAVAYYQATGKKNLLAIAEKSAQHINKVFFEGDKNYNEGVPVNQAPGHQEIELALVKLYRATNNALYLTMAKRFVDIRGITYTPTGDGVMSPEYAQQHVPVREQKEAVGHSVRATYLYSAMADVGALTEDSTLLPALKKIWGDIVNTRMHITGGLGAIHGIEGFGPQYELPNKEAYNETCAAVGNVFFNHRMFLLEKDGKYMDVAEVALFNNVLAGVNLEGNKFFYVNPLESVGNVDRSHWFGTACCPTNLARLIPQVSGLMYSHTEKDIYVSLYTSSQTNIPLKKGDVQITQKTNYPFDESIYLSVNPKKNNQKFSLNLRIPTWTENQFVPGELYHYIDNNKKEWSISINGEFVDNPTVEKGFVSIHREWKEGDKVVLHLPMPVRYNHAIKKVEANINRVAITKGPLVYCAEGVDNEGELRRYYIDEIDKTPLIKKGDNMLENIDIISNLSAHYLDENGEATFRSIAMLPYYAWNNRGVSTMNVWFAENEELVRLTAPIMPLALKSIRASYTHEYDDVLAVVSGNYPKSSFDTTIPRWTAYPKLGGTETVDFMFKEQTPVKSVAIYWYDDNGGVQLPVSWNLEYKIGDSEWLDFPLYTTDYYTILKDQFNLVHSAGEDFVIDALRINMKSKQNSSVGVLQVQIEVD